MSKLVAATVLAAFISVNSQLSAQQSSFTTEDVPYTPTMFTVSSDGSVTSRPISELPPPLPPAQWVAECPFRPGCADPLASFKPCAACAKTLRAMDADISRRLESQFMDLQLQRIESQLTWLSLELSMQRTVPLVITPFSPSLIPLMNGNGSIYLFLR